ncbi:MAG: hypothetical protein COV72_07365 [Candidatus Omnitrophica bacterium CG11_big_fil_rev_8_21_14_0_20_42_13]|uniref:Response regulatory domain-containing protein n=1 Tax=Candidatus Ghiorseimicrobium undicola TaxID=1974746 RepID=A0A2H0LW53_9BACT|nr:MAG: hypothetical protein COV72_07365 [Candidatus Omnitrophica bacterium CG11_big_fil_rev_8_21_14_0_20_42_13]
MAKKILIIEDESDTCKALRFRFENRGFDVICAKDGRDGLEKAQAEFPALIILDLMLPELSGEEVCKEIRRNESIAKVPIIMLTAKDTDTDRVVGRVIGADSYMTKPFEIEELLREINRLIENKTNG